MFDKAFELTLSQATENATYWPKICDLVSAKFNAVGAVILSVDTRGNGPWITHSETLKETTEAYIKEGWHKADMRMRLAQRLYDNHVITDDDLGPRETLASMPYYRDFLMRFGLGYSACGIIRTNYLNYGFSLQFPFEREPFSETEKSELKDVCSAIESVVAIASSKASHKIADYSQLLGESASEVLILDPFGEVVSDENLDITVAPTPVLGLLSEDQIHHLKLVCSSPVEEKQSAAFEFQKYGTSMQLLAFQLPSSLRHFHLQHKVICILREATDRELLLSGWLKSSYNLTESEIHTALFMTKGLQPSEIAELRGVATTTINQRVKSIYAKMNVRNQLQLVGTLNRKFR